MDSQIKIERPKLVNLNEEYQSSHACISMVTGLNFDRLLDILPDRVLSLDEQNMALAAFGFYAKPQNPRDFTDFGNYITTVPSLNIKGAMHVVVLHISDLGPVLLDPYNGVDGKEHYSFLAPSDKKDYPHFYISDTFQVINCSRLFKELPGKRE